MSSKVSYRQQISYCGKPQCRKCSRGIGHGPYWYEYRTVNGQTTRTYIGKKLPPEIQARLEKVAQSPNRLIQDELEGATVRVFTFGHFRLERRTQRQWQPVSEAGWQQPAVRSLLAYLLCSPERRARRSQLLAALWPTEDPESATRRLSRALSTLQHLLTPRVSRPKATSLLQTSDEWISLADQAALWCDASAFTRLASRPPSTNEEEYERQLRRAIALYNGDFLPEEHHAPWVLSQRQKLRQDWLSLLLALADLSLKRNETTAALDQLDRILIADPTYEPAVQRFLYALSLLKRRGEAIRAYHRFYQALQKEQLSPSAETMQIYEAIRQGHPLRFPFTTQPRRERPPERPILRPEKPIQTGSQQIGRTHQNPLVGREQELQQLQALLQEIEEKQHGAAQRRSSAVPLYTQRRPQCMFLLGDAGIGKTRLAEELGRIGSQRGWLVIWSRVYQQESGIPYHIWTEALRKLLVETELFPTLRSKLLTPVPAVGEAAPELMLPSASLQPLKALLPELAGPQPPLYPSLSPEQDQLRLWEATQELLIEASQSVPLLIVLDDIQWTDSSSGELLGYLARHIDGYPIFLLATCRESELAPTHPLRNYIAHMQREHTINMLQVKPLSREAIGKMVAHLPEEMVERIQEKAAGNPFFAEELARSTPPALPGSIAAALDHRLNRLSRPCQHTLCNAAILGGSFEFHMLSSLEHDADEDTLLEQLEEALQSGVLIEEGSGSRITYHFWHPLMVDHLYKALSRIRRARLHQRAATILEEMYQGRTDEVAAAIVHHLIRGDAEPARIVHYAEIAGDHAQALSAFAEAEKHYQFALHYLEKLDQQSERRTALQERLAECLMIRGNFQEAHNLYNEILQAQGHALPLYEAQKQALLHGEVGRAWRNKGETTLAHQACEQGMQILREAGITSGFAWARLLYQQGSIYSMEGRYTAAWEAAQRALDYFSYQPDTQHPTSGFTTRLERTLQGDQVNLGNIRRLLGQVAAAEGRLGVALEHLTIARNIFEQAEHKRLIGHVSCDLSYVLIKMGRLKEAQAALRHARTLAEQIGDTPLMGVVYSNYGELAASQKNYEEAESWYQKSIVLAEQHSDKVYISMRCAQLALMQGEQGKLSVATRQITRSIRTARAIQNNPCLGTALIVLGTLRTIQADEAETIPILQKHLLRCARRDIERALHLPGLEAELLLKGKLALAAVAVRQGTAEAQTLLAEVEASATRSSFTFLSEQAHELRLQAP